MEIKRKEGLGRMRIVGHNKKLLWVIIILIILLVIMITYIKISDNKKAKLEQEDKSEENWTSLELDKVVSFLDICLNASTAKMEELKNLSTEEINKQRYSYEDIVACRDTNIMPIPSLQKINQLRKMQYIQGEKVFSIEGEMNTYSISKILNSSCTQLWEIQYTSTGTKPYINTLRVYQCVEVYYFTKDFYMHDVPAKTFGSIFKIRDEDNYIIVQAIDNLVGADKDIHGCIGSAGYSWCEEKQKCLRIWEENCSSV